MKQFLKSNVISTGVAMFAMFFGAGNVVFALALGQFGGSKNIYGIAGFLITAVIMPLLGLISMILYEGDYHAFFGRLGKSAGFLLVALCMALMGPFAAIPRIIALSHATLKGYVPSLSLFTFTALACALIYVCTYKKGRILDLLGYVLGPLKIFFLILFIIAGVLFHPAAVEYHHSAAGIFMRGFAEGYKTLDLVAAFFFSSVVLVNLRRTLEGKADVSQKQIAWFCLKASCIAAFLLGIIYVGFSYVASYYGHLVGSVGNEELFSAIIPLLLGSWAALIGNFTISLACLTTAITLVAIFSDYIQKELLVGKIDYHSSLVFTLVATFAMANLGFSGILTLIAPIIFLLYPVFIVLSLVNIAHKLWHFKYVKLPVFTTFVLSLLHYFA